MKKLLLLMIFALASIMSVSALDIISPIHGTYNGSIIELRVNHSDMLDNITYSLNNYEFLACKNCSGFIREMNLTEGEYNITAIGTKGNETFVSSVIFFVNLTDGQEEQDNGTAFDLVIEKPTHSDYEEGMIEIRITSDRLLDKIEMNVTGYFDSCLNCSLLSGFINLSKGNYTLFAKGVDENLTVDKNVSFRVLKIAVPVNDSDDGNETSEEENDDDSENEPRFATGFEKLPKQLMNGEINDSELANILKNNQLNPGIINRLIKTGKLGNQSLEAILEYQQFRPVGIWNKFLAFIGYKENTYSAQISKRYVLSERLEKRLVKREDLPKGLVNKVQDRLEEKNNKREQDRLQIKKNESKSKAKSFEVGKQLPKKNNKEIKDTNSNQNKKTDKEKEESNQKQTGKEKSHNNNRGQNDGSKGSSEEKGKSSDNKTKDNASRGNKD